MSIIEIALIGVGLAMDAFAVSICKGLAMRKMNYRQAIIIAGFFGVFQALMPALGYLLGTTFANKIAVIDHWIAFILLGLIGLSMIKESFENDDEESCQDERLRLGDLIMLSIATSIDALAIGITFSFFEVPLLLAISLIGIITFVICVIGVKVGNVFGKKYKNKAELAGGIILILMGSKILIEHLFF
ncbi:manganese efflux pump MntP family protein [Thomasclavelia sp.]|uniref:manganese efflux pump MntP n=1 Tax=Thomasclavelia sp. TaxID=3025757 RepID=UPI0025FAC2AF|nr:manganese efflux pump MntP family protein [Thomasclavelia sp.]